MQRFLTVNEFSEATRQSLASTHRGIKAEKIPCTRIGRRLLIPASFLDELEAEAFGKGA